MRKYLDHFLDLCKNRIFITAQEISRCAVRDRIRLTGRLQSRIYVKQTPEGPIQRTAYEISALTAEITDEVL